MKMFELKCPYCGADLEVKDDLDTFFCIHCGGQIIMDGMDNNTVNLRIKAKEIDYKKYKIDKETQDKRHAREMKLEEKKEANRSERFITVAMVGLIVFMFLLATVVHFLEG